MSFSRAISATLLSGVVSFSLVTASGCGTKAVGIDECRDIEQARCRAGSACGIIEDVAACERYYRDHCLHGLATAPPSGATVDGCVQVIRGAGECAKTDPETPLDECEVVPTSSVGLTSACDVVRHPERTAECSFLTDTPPEEGGGGQGGTTNDEPSSAGQGGTGGASDAPAE